MGHHCSNHKNMASRLLFSGDPAGVIDMRYSTGYAYCCEQHALLRKEIGWHDVVWSGLQWYGVV
jgi:hypothetical protein